MLESMLLTFWLMSASMPEGCAVTGTVFHSTEQTFALLRSDCLIDIQRHDRWIIMTSPRWVVAVEIPPTFGKRQFTYSWGSPWALLGSAHITTEVMMRSGAHPSGVEDMTRDSRAHATHP